MSLHDMYFSSKNKNYMYETIAKLIREETDFDISHSKHHIEIYRRNYPLIFHNINTDELSVLNKELINHMGNIYLKQLNSVNTILNTAKTTSEENTLKPEIKIQEKKYKNYTIHSSHRNTDSLNRYDFNINVDFSEFIPEKITILKEDNNLFSNPSIIVQFNEKENLQFSLKETKSFNDKDYYTYECVTEDTIQCKDKLNIKILNYLMMTPLENNDIYKINMIKSIKHNDKDYLCLQIDNHDINENDELGLLSDNKIIKSLFVKKCVQNYILTNVENVDHTKKYSCLQCNKNIEISGSIH
jgi:hypothetical protein